MLEDDAEVMVKVRVVDLHDAINALSYKAALLKNTEPVDSEDTWVQEAAEEFRLKVERLREALEDAEEAVAR